MNEANKQTNNKNFDNGSLVRFESVYPRQQLACTSTLPRGFLLLCVKRET